MIRCKVCGYIMKEGKLGDKCPACGVPKTNFEPYNDPMGRSRRMILNLHLHPIAVHFPTTFAVAVFVFAFASVLFSGTPQNMLIDTVKILAVLLPVLVIATFWLGWWDGKIRFRRITASQILKRKIVYAIALFVVSTVMAVLIWIGEFTSFAFSFTSIILAAAAVIFSYLLGLLGMSISNAALPGK